MVDSRIIKFRAGIVLTILIFFWATILIKLFIIQIIDSNCYKEICLKQSTEKEIIEPIRGTIFDRNGNPLTMNILTYSIFAHPYLITDKKKIAENLSKLTGKPISYYYNLINNKKTFVWIEKELTIDKINEKYIDSIRTQGIEIKKKYRRYYPYKDIFAHVIGFVGTENKGLCGLELQYDPILRGVPGWKIILKDGFGRVIPASVKKIKKAINGNDIYLTLDKEYQTILYEELKTAYQVNKADKAMGIIMNPKTGEILAIASVPSYDPNRPGKYPIANQKISSITDIFEPGSTLKIITAAAALEEKKIEPDDTIFCEYGKITIGDIIIHDAEPYGTLKFSEVIEKSSNIGTIKIAHKVGKKKLYEYFLRFGFGTKTGVNLPGEENGIVHELEDWNEITLAQVSIGQGICSTVIQLASAYCAIANSGYLMKPIIVRQIISPDNIKVKDFSPELIRKVTSKTTSLKLRSMLELTVEEGTGIHASIKGIKIAGKTGTAQKVIDGKYSKRDYIANFVGFTPVEDPKYLCVVVVDNPRGKYHTGGYVSAPVVRDVFKRIINIDDNLTNFVENKIKNNEKITSQNNSYNYQKNEKPLLITYSLSNRMPNLIGKTLRESLNLIVGLNLDIEIDGSGVVYYQSIKPGSIVKPNDKCLIKLKEYD
ncbi:MAG: transpeptidase family protein [Candidatus Marinimicrobia bacterium]|nr:transpeptidase family protein [Candidatus Neomarinimicrobiota bacterium]